MAQSNECPERIVEFMQRLDTWLREMEKYFGRTAKEQAVQALADKLGLQTAHAPSEEPQSSFTARTQLGFAPAGRE